MRREVNERRRKSIRSIGAEPEAGAAVVGGE